MTVGSAIEVLRPLFNEAYTLVLALALAAARPLGIVAVMPLFTRAEIGGVVKAAFALAFSLPILPRMLDEFNALGLTSFVPLTAYTGKEFALGVLIGLLLGIPFWCVQAVGELIDMQRGVSTEPVSDPGTKAQSSVTSILLGLVSMVVFVGANGLNIVADTLYQSYALWPVARFLPNFATINPSDVYGVLGTIMRYMMVIAGPIVLLMLLCDLALLFMARAAPQLSVYSLAPMVKSVVFIVFVLAYLPYMLDYVAQGISETRGVPDALRLLLR